MEGTTNKCAQYWITIIVSLASMTASISYSWATPVLPMFHNNETDIHLTDEEMSWLVSITAPGLMAGCLASQYPIKRFGRKPIVMSSALPFIIGAIFVLTAKNSWMLCIARFCWGFSCGILQTVIMIYIVEIASKDIRGKLTVGNRFIYNLGAFLAMVVGSFSYQTLNWLLAVIPVFYFIAFLFVIPETPYFFLKEGKVDAAGKVLKKLNGYDDEKILDEKLTEMRLSVKHEMRRSGGLKELLTGQQYRRALMISIGLACSRMLCGSIPMKQYVGRILQATTSDISVTGGLILFGAVTLITSVIATLLVDKLGRRPLLIFSFLSSSVLLAVLGGCFFMDEMLNIKPPFFGYINLFINLCLCVVSTIGYDTVGFIIPAELFPLNVKSTAMTFLSLFGHIVNFASIRGYQIVKNFSGLFGVFWFFGSVAFIGALFTYFVIPETKGKSLKEIQQELQGDLFDDANTVLNNGNMTDLKEVKSTDVEDGQ